MKRTYRVRLLSLLSSIVLAGLVVACDQDQDLGYAPDDCHHAKPSTGFLVVKGTIEPAHLQVPFAMYRGSMESGTIVLRDTLTTEEEEYEMPVGYQYTVAARYIVPPDTVLVIDAARLEVHSQEYEDATCYYVDAEAIDVRLRN